jgi:hypothetical protein
MRGGKRIKAVFAVSAILMACALMAAAAALWDNSLPDDPPALRVSVNGQFIPCAAYPVFWKGAAYDRISPYQKAWGENPDMQGLACVDEGESFLLELEGRRPDTIQIRFVYLTRPGQYPLWPAEEVEFIGSGESRYAFFSPIAEVDRSWWIYGRLYTVTAAWGENRCEYVFLSGDGVARQNVEADEDFCIVDTGQTALQALERIFEDQNYVYYLSSIRSHAIYVEFADGTRRSLREVLDREVLSIAALMDKGLPVILEKSAVYG